MQFSLRWRDVSDAPQEEHQVLLWAVMADGFGFPAFGWYCGADRWHIIGMGRNDELPFKVTHWATKPPMPMALTVDSERPPRQFETP